MNLSTADLAGNIRNLSTGADATDWNHVRRDLMNQIADLAFDQCLNLTHAIDLLAAEDPDEGGTLTTFQVAAEHAACDVEHA